MRVKITGKISAGSANERLYSLATGKLVVAAKNRLAFRTNLNYLSVTSQEKTPKAFKADEKDSWYE